MQRTTMYYTEGQFIGNQGLPLYYQYWQLHQTPRAIVVLIHGLGSHSGLFFNIVDWLLPQGYIVYGFDLRGHGRSPGKRGHINSWDEFRGDVDRCFDHIAQLEQRQSWSSNADPLPRILVGHSLGGVIGLDYALRHPETLAGVVAIAPALGDVGIPPLKLTIGKALSKVWPRFSLSTGLGHDCASRDPAIIEQYQCDPLRHTYGTARLATEFIHANKWIHHHAADLQCPLLILHGLADQVALAAGSDRFFQNVALADKTRYEYDGAYHDLHNDINYPTVLQDLSDWLERHLTNCPHLQPASLAKHRST
ncbi:MAG: alpha/beta hydrolase [Leptolyngbyaceae bacterium]|nr:alpha/beta hydrolase [Leptolyngbyaceae bacterium]